MVISKALSSSAVLLSFYAAPVVWDYQFVFPLNVSSNCVPPQKASNLYALPWNLIVYGPPIQQALTDIDIVSCFITASETWVIYLQRIRR